MGEYRESYLMKIDHPDGAARIWSGVGDLEVPADIVEAAPAIYLGAGTLLDLPTFRQLINGVAERVEFTVSGVDDNALRMALEDAPGVKNSAIYIGRIDFDENWQQLGSIEWEATFRADTLTVESQSENGMRQRTIKLSAGTDDTGRSYAPTSSFTDADQRLRSPDDSVFDHVAGITRGKSRIFGPRYKEKSGGLF